MFIFKFERTKAEIIKNYVKDNPTNRNPTFNNVNFKDYAFKKLIGEGASGRVYASVKKPDGKKVYAIKVVNLGDWDVDDL